MGRFRKRKNEAKTTEGGSWGTKYDNIVKDNSIFENYYKLQKIIPDDEWDSFISHLKEPLPASFRITPYRSQAKMMLKTIQSEYFKDLTEEEMQPICLPWYPDNLAWQLKLSKRDIRKSEANVKLHNFLVSETDAGSISRQETVSMIPPIVLDVKPHHKVLDMCAAPGSKTTQLIEMLHTDESKMPEGVVVANDANNKRCYMLVHQLKRLQSPCVLITNHDASTMPNIHLSTSDGESILKFDRILCDVPCTGDGTMRKNLDIWAKWNTANGCNLHGLQFRIARRGLEMLTVGGQIVYSTCSLNPIEDEAVIHRLLVEAKGSVQVVDVSHLLPGLKYQRGLSHWAVTDRELRVYESPDLVPEAKRNLIRASIYPPKPEEAPNFHLDRCIRVLPHQQNTGGFFVAVLKKTGPLPWESAAKLSKSVPEAKAEEDGDVPVGEENSGRRSPMRKKRRTNVFKEDPFIFFDENEPLWPHIRDFFGISDSMDPTLLLTRTKEGKKRNIYVVSPLVRDITRANEGHLQIINTGVRTFSRSDNKGSQCHFRITEEGAPILMRYMSKRRVLVNREDLVILLMNDLSELAPELGRFSSATVDQLKTIETGSVLIDFKDDSLEILLVGWKGDHSLRAFVPKNDRVHHLRLVGGDFSKFVVNKFKDGDKTKEAKNEETKDVPENPEEDSENQAEEELSLNTD